MRGRAQLVVGLDEAACIGAHPGPLQLQPVGVGATADGQQYGIGVEAPALRHHRGLILALGALRFLEVRDLRAQHDLHATCFQNAAHLVGNVAVLARQKGVQRVDDRHFRAEGPVHEGKFQTDVATADDHHPPGMGLQRQHAGAVMDPGAVHARDLRHHRQAAGIDEDALRADGALPLLAGVTHGAGDDHGVGILEACTGVDDAHPLHLVQFGEVGSAQLRDQAILGLHGRRKDVGPLGGAGGAALAFHQQFLGRDAADVDAGAPVHLVGSFHQNHVLAMLGQVGSQRLAGLAETDDEVGGLKRLHDRFALIECLSAVRSKMGGRGRGCGHLRTTGATVK